MATYLTTTSELTAVADAIRSKANTQSALVFPSGFVSTISAIQTGTASVEMAAATYSANQGTKCAITLSNGFYQETWSSDDTGKGPLGTWLEALTSTRYMMVATSTGAVAWKGVTQNFSFYNGTDPMSGITNENYYTGGGAYAHIGESMWGYEDPEMGWQTNTSYNADITATDSSCPTVYLSTTSF